MTGKTAKNTEGTFEVTVRGDLHIDFTGDAGEMRLHRDPSQEWHLAGLHRLSEAPEDFLACDVYLPADLPLDATPHTYNFADGKARLHFWTREHQGNQTYVAFEGTVVVAFDGTHITASFKCTAAFGSSRLTLDGKAELTGLSTGLTAQYPAKGHLSATFVGGPHPGPHFVANELRIDSSNFDGHRPDRWIFIGEHKDDGLPQVRNIIGIVIDKAASGLKHDLAGNNQVRIQYQRVPGLAFTAYAGELLLDELASDDKASGTFTCSFQAYDGQEFTLVDGNFALNRA